MTTSTPTVSLKGGTPVRTTPDRNVAGRLAVFASELGLAPGAEWPERVDVRTATERWPIHCLALSTGKDGAIFFDCLSGTTVIVFAG